MRPFFSIVIPTLNEEKFLPSLLSDLSKQKDRDFDVVVSDGFSTDKTAECIENFRKFFQIKFIQNKLRGPARQRNYGAAAADGGYLIFLDADTRINPTFIKNVKKTIIKKKGLLFVPYFLPDREYKQYKMLFDLANAGVELSQILPTRFSLGGSLIIEKNFFNLIGGYNEKLFMSEDHDIVHRAAQWGVQIKFIREARTYFSLRRLKKEGQLQFFYKTFISFYRRMILNEDIKSKIFEYEMGGQNYREEKHREKKEEFFRHYFNRVKDLFNKILTT